MNSPHHGVSRSPNHLPQLDGLRAVAVACVLAFHFIPGIDRVAPLGSIGVRLFFVLSGFLITRILLASRDWETGYALRIFYARRALRILPVFYLVLGLAALIDIGPVRSTIGWHVSYLTNFYLFDRGSWHGPVSHLWSLAVEEQFYLVWPLVVLTVRPSRLPGVIVTMMAFAPLSRILIGGSMNSVLPTSCFDSLGAGALLALPSSHRQIRTIGVLAGVPLFVGALVMRYAGGTGVPLEVALDLGVSLTSAWLVGRAAIGFTGAVGNLLTAPAVTAVGAISYGLYLFHGFMPYVLGRFIEGFVDMAWPVRALLLTAATFAAAAMSWRLLERPLLALKPRLQEAVHDVRVHVA